MVEAEPLTPIAPSANEQQRHAQYRLLLERLTLMLTGETDWVAAMATTACELHHAFDYYHWTGFYRAPSNVSPTTDPTLSSATTSSDQPMPTQLVLGPYQGSLGCLRIPFSKGVCGAAARSKTSQLVPDVHQFPGHIACASSTQSELVVPVLTPSGSLLAVLDVDSNHPAAFTAADQQGCEALCSWMGQQTWRTGLL